MRTAATPQELLLWGTERPSWLSRTSRGPSALQLWWRRPDRLSLHPLAAPTPPPSALAALCSLSRPRVPRQQAHDSSLTLSFMVTQACLGHAYLFPLTSKESVESRLEELSPSCSAPSRGLQSSSIFRLREVGSSPDWEETDPTTSSGRRRLSQQHQLQVLEEPLGGEQNPEPAPHTLTAPDGKHFYC